MLRLLRQVSARQLRASLGRSALVVGGIGIGVALIVAINVMNTSVLENFRRSIETLAGPAALEITLGVGEIGFPEATVATVASLPGVASAIPLLHGTVALSADPTETLQLFGADLTNEEDLKRYQITLTTDHRDIIEWLNDPRSIALTNVFAQRRGIAVGDTLELLTPQGITKFTVRGLLDAQGMALAFGGQLALMDLPAAQLVLAKDRQVDQVDVILKPGADLARTQAALKKALPSTLTVERPALRGEAYEHVLSSFQTMLAGFSLLCLVAGIYIVYNTTSTSAVHRALALARLRIIGADGDQLFRLLMFEALLLGMLGTAIGIPTGVVLARFFSWMISDSMGAVFQLRFPGDGLTVAWREQCTIALFGIVAALFSSFFAARRVARLEPLAVLRADLRGVASRTPTRQLVLWWLVLVGISAVALVLEVRFQSIALGNFASTLWFASSIVIAVPIVSASSSVLSHWLGRMSAASGRVAAESLFRSPTRTGVTVAAVTLVLTVAITFASLIESLRESASSFYKEGGFLRGDVVVSAVATEGGWLETPLPDSLGDELRRVPGVRAVDVARALPGQPFRDERITLLALSDGLLAASHYGDRWYVEGRAADAAPELIAGRGANISIAMANRFGLHLGDRVELQSPSGLLELPVVGIVRDYMSDRGTVTVNYRLFLQQWHDPRVQRFSVFLAPGADVEQVRKGIAQQIGDRYRLKILLPAEMVAYHVGHINRAFAWSDAIQFLIVTVTVAGIFDLLLAAIRERRRELALWRVVGADDAAVHRSVIIESATIGSLGAVLGTFMGLVTAWTWVGVHFRYLLGFYLEYHFAVGDTLKYIVLVIAMTVVAGYNAARYATRQSVLEGIQTD